MATRDRNPRRRGSLLIGLSVLGLFLAATAAIVSVFGVGMRVGLALAGAGAAVYVVPAAVLGWLLPTIGDVAAFVADLLRSVVEGVAPFFRSLFD